MTTAVTLGSGALAYEPVEGWARLPEGWSFRECADVAVDSQDRVYVFNRGEHPLMVFDRDGNFLTSWGEGVFTTPHGITLGPDETLYLADQRDHTIRRFTKEGELLMTLGTPHKPPARWSGSPFNEPTHVAISPVTGDLYISDGYGNSRIHRYSADGRHIKSWGASGIDPGEFVIPHDILVDDKDNIIVADRENHRIQVFTAEGELQYMWNNIWKPTGICFGLDGNLYIAELGGESYYADAPNVGNRVSVYSLEGKLLARLGMPTQGEGPGHFLAPHGITMDSRGDIYVAEVSWTIVAQRLDAPREMKSLQKLAKKG